MNCEYCGGTGEVPESSTRYMPCPKCKKQNADKPVDPQGSGGAARGTAEKRWTPGPWCAWDRGIGWEVFCGPDQGVKPGLRLNDEHRNTFEEADAHLIAAAPELYEALERLLKIQTLEPLHVCHPINIARKALAKARGEVA